MYKLPKNLLDLEPFRSNPMIQFKEEIVDGVNVTIPCYMISDNELWTSEYALELRGHVFNTETGDLISAALPKFFNVNENSWTQYKELPWDDITNVADKCDGSMITFSVINDKVFAKTKKSFYSDVAKEAQTFLDTTEEGAEITEVVKAYLAKGLSPIYEFWHPEWQIVLNYGDKPMMRYLGYRDMSTSKWIPSAAKVDENEADYIIYNSEKWHNETEGIEGVVCQFADGRVVKLKTAWYLQQHRVRTEMRERDVAELAALEQLDDIKSVVTEAGMDIALINAIETRVADQIASIVVEVNKLLADVRATCPTPKDAALKYRDHEYFGMMMRLYRGQEVNYVDYFMDHYLKQNFGLKCVYNEKF